MRRTRSVSMLLAALLIVVFAGCASLGEVQAQLSREVGVGNYPAALDLVESERNGVFGGKNRLLYFLERGMLLHLEGQYAESNVAFEEAKRIGDALYTESITDIGVSFMTNDYALDYAGENFERTLIHLFSAMNYSELGEPDSALVEARQVGDYLRKLQVDTPNENVYHEDAFARYLAALLYEASGEYDAALVAYKKAIVAYGQYGSAFSVGMPSSLYPNAERVAARLGRWAEEDLATLGSTSEAREIPPGAGELVILHYNGLSPIKGQRRITIPFSKAWAFVVAFQAIADDAAREQIGQATTVIGSIRGVDVVSVAFPKFVDRPYRIARMEPRVVGATQTTGPELVEDVGAIAEKDLADRTGRIYAKAVARAAIKYAIQKAAELAARQVDGDYGALLSAGTQIVGNLARYGTEQADKRVWSTLPDKIYMSSMVLPAGTHDVDIDFLTNRSTVVESRRIPQVEVVPGGRRFLVVRTVK